MDNREIDDLRNNIAKNSIIKILTYSIIVIILVVIFIDVIFNDDIAEKIYTLNDSFYYFCVANKAIIMSIMFTVIFFVTTFLVVRNSNNYMLEMINSMDKILKEPEKDIKLSNGLVLLEGKLNKIRIDLIKNKNIAKEEEQKKNDLIMYMAHDLKTPLTSIIGYLTLLTQEKEISPKLQQKYMKIALNKSFRVEELINQFFEITRYNLQNMPITKNRIDLSVLLEQIIDECYPMLKERNLKYKTNIPEHLYFIGDGDKLARAFENLIKNAINYSYENSDIEINLESDVENIKITFKNRGDKIPTYKLDKIFEKFYRVDEARTTTTGGTGLGLAITKEIIELHGGNICVKNDYEFIEFCVVLYNNNIE